ncbi:hypothetical protein K443DRAFT_9498 [Laccaria amethystina LaAM-08-1]|uniref:Secreted protein n=1 Tax=Laccaria amethystina LaAM-08-1 TaxID=1095629 RepID=A0A0C9XPV3_9AGAR|nr:hypothetical protein K443DRAFT_9498 [Laccaria amethystina LaAM-08-1]
MLRPHRRCRTLVVGLPLVSITIDSAYCHIATRMMSTGQRMVHPGQQTRESSHATYMAWRWKWNHGAPRTTNERGQCLGTGESDTPQQDQETRCTQDSKREATAPMPHMWMGAVESWVCCPIAIERAHPRHRRTSPNDANERPHTQVRERGSPPMPRTQHGHWGIGHMPNHECAHIPVPSFPPR